MKIRRHYFFSGRVQGVGFRYRARYLAEGFSLTGWVRNLPDERVEMEVQGKEAEIYTLIQFLDGHRWIRIDAMDVENIAVIPDHDFVER